MDDMAGKKQNKSQFIDTWGEEFAGSLQAGEQLRAKRTKFQ